MGNETRSDISAAVQAGRPLFKLTIPNLQSWMSKAFEVYVEAAESTGLPTFVGNPR